MLRDAVTGGPARPVVGLRSGAPLTITAGLPMARLTLAPAPV